MTRWLAILGFMAGVGLIFYAVFHEESDEEKIRAVLVRLEDAVRVEEPANNVLIRQAELVAEFNEIFEKDVSVKIPELSSVTSGRDELAGLAARAAVYYQMLELDFGSISVEAGNIAVDVRATARLAASRGGTVEDDERSVAFQFTKSDGAWRISSVSVTPKTDQTLEDRFGR